MSFAGFEPELPPIYGDAEKLHQVFINLFNNAQYAMAEGGELNIRTGRTLQEVLVSVQDTGTGIPEHIKKKIFDPFFTTKEVGKGTGLGLSVTYGIVKEHGGSIEVESPATSTQQLANSSRERPFIYVFRQANSNHPTRGYKYLHEIHP